MKERDHSLFPRHTVLSVAGSPVSKPTAGRAVAALEGAGVLVESTGKKRDRVWVYRRYLDRLRVGTELETPGRL